MSERKARRDPMIPRRWGSGGGDKMMVNNL